MTSPPALNTMKMGPGTLTFGATGSLMDVSAQVTKCATKWKANAGNDVTTLSGAVLPGDRNYTCQLAFTVHQDDLAAGGMTDWTYTNKGSQVPFTFTPKNGGRSIAGEITVDPIDTGGDVGARNTTDVTWDCVGEPVLADDL